MWSRHVAVANDGDRFVGCNGVGLIPQRIDAHRPRADGRACPAPAGPPGRSGRRRGLRLPGVHHRRVCEYCEHEPPLGIRMEASDVHQGEMDERGPGRRNNHGCRTGDGLRPSVFPVRRELILPALHRNSHHRPWPKRLSGLRERHGPGDVSAPDRHHRRALLLCDHRPHHRLILPSPTHIILPWLPMDFREIYGSVADARQGIETGPGRRILSLDATWVVPWNMGLPSRTGG